MRGSRRVRSARARRPAGRVARSVAFSRFLDDFGPRMEASAAAFCEAFVDLKLYRFEQHLRAQLARREALS